MIVEDVIKPKTIDARVGGMKRRMPTFYGRRDSF
jgi:hypothetical protein